MLGLLGLNKQLDLQTLFIQAGRELAVALGWCGERRRLQLIFVLVLGTVMIGVLLTMLWKRRRFFGQNPWTLPGLGLLAAYVLLRTMGIDHVGEFPGLNLDDSPWLDGLELSGIICFVVAGGRATKTALQPHARELEAN